MKFVTRTMATGLVAALVVGLAQHADAALLVYEPFDYANGSDILGQGGATGGFSGDWAVDGAVPAGSFTAVSGSLPHPTHALPTSGGHAFLTGEFGTLTAKREFASDVVGADGTTTWISFLGERRGPVLQAPHGFGNNNYPRGVNVGHFDAQSTANAARAERLSVGNSSGAAENRWGLIPEGYGAIPNPISSSCTVRVATQTQLIPTW